MYGWGGVRDALKRSFFKLCPRLSVAAPDRTPTTNGFVLPRARRAAIATRFNSALWRARRTNPNVVRFNIPPFLLSPPSLGRSSRTDRGVNLNRNRIGCGAKFTSKYESITRRDEGTDVFYARLGLFLPSPPVPLWSGCVIWRGIASQRKPLEIQKKKNC